MATRGTQELAWGSDDEEESSGLDKHPPPTPAQHKQRTTQTQKTIEPGPQAQPAATSTKSVPSLQALCLGLLGDYLGELLDCAADVLPLLPTQFKGCLMGIARRRGLLDDRALAILTDEEQGCLDCHGSAVTEPAVRKALSASPQLRHVDLSGCPVGPATLGLLGEACRQVEVLRIGGSPVTDSGSGSCSGALRRLLPLLEKAQHADVESWECLADRIEGADLTSGSGRLMSLRCLVWPSMPFELQKHCKSSCPLLAVNPTREEVTKQGWPAEFDPAYPLDAALFAGLDDASRWEMRQEASEAPVVHIAERFRLAYAEQAARLRERAERAERRWVQQRRREIRRSPAEVAIRRWLNES